MSRQHTLRIATLALVSGLVLAPMVAIPATAEASRVPAPGSAYSMEVLVDGNPLSVYSGTGTNYVEALKGREYAIRLTNRTGERVAVALAVDGLNSIDARHTSSQDARKWILAPWETVTLSGWQTGSGTARRFVFTSESKSYGAWLNRTNDLGVISAAFFRESHRACQIAPSLSRPAPSSPEPLVEGGVESGVAKDAPQERLRGEAKKAAKDELAATGIGREIEHQVTEVDFDEADSPASIINLRYEYHDVLVRLGVIPRDVDALARRERARGFAEPGFAPDPYREHR